MKYGALFVTKMLKEKETVLSLVETVPYILNIPISFAFNGIKV